MTVSGPAGQNKVPLHALQSGVLRHALLQRNKSPLALAARLSLLNPLDMCIEDRIRALEEQYRRGIDMEDVKTSDGVALLIAAVFEGVPILAALLLAFKVI